MSVKREILESIADYLDTHPRFKDYKDLEYYYDPYTMNANTELPAFCFYVGYNDDNSEQGNRTISHYCRSYYNNIEIRLHTVTKEPDILMEELWDFEESLFACLNNNVNWSQLHPNFENLKYVGTLPMVSMYKQAFRDDYEDEWVCNILRVSYELEYTLR